MGAFEVVHAMKKKDVDGKHGPMQVIAMGLRDNGEAKEAEWFTKASTPLPTVGASLEGELTWDEKFNVWKFKKAQQGGGGFSRSPRDSARIERQHSQEMALRAYSLTSAGKGSNLHNTEQMQKAIRLWTDWFVKDLDNASDPTGSSGLDTPKASANGGDSAATGFASQKQKDFVERLLNETPAKEETVGQIMLYLGSLPREEQRERIDRLTSDRATARFLADEAAEWAKGVSDAPPPDTADLPMADDPMVQF